MGFSGNESRNDESQASQLLAAALRPRDLPPIQSNAQSQANGEQETLDGSVPSSSSNSVHYHMNGMMPTQTQSLYSSQDPLYGEGSQKENAPTAPGKPTSSPSNDPSRNGSPRTAESGSYPSAKGTMEKPCPKACGPSDQTSNAPLPVKASKAVAFASPSHPGSRPQAEVARTSTAANRSMPPRRVRSPSPASQDSFAGPLPERDPVQAYLEQAKPFQIPLSRLGEDSQSVSEGEDGLPPVSSDMWAQPSKGRTLRPLSPPGKILVEGTPSNSSRSNGSRSQSQSQARRSQSHYAESQQSGGDTQLDELFPPGQGHSIEAEMANLVDAAPIDTDNDEGQDPSQSILPPSRRSQSDVSTEPSSSYERIANQDPFAPVPEATQPAHPTVEETQPVDYSRFSNETDPSTIARNHEFSNDYGQIVFPSVPSVARSNHTTRSEIPRGLLQLVAPHKRYRYMDIVGSPAPSTQRPTDDVTINTTVANSTVEETQVSDISVPTTSGDVDETQPSDASAALQTPVPSFPRRTLPTATRALQSLKSRQKSPSTDIVPDSEEARIVPDSDPPAPPRSPSAGPPTTQSSPTKPRSRRGFQSEDEVLQTVMEATASSVNAIPEEEEEEDVPLAAVAQSAKVKGKQRATGPQASSAISPTTAKARDLNKTGGSNPIRDHGLARKASSWKDAVVPSSDPQELREEVAARPQGGKPRTPVEQIAPPPPKSRTAPRQAKTVARGRLHESSDEDEDEDVVIPDQDDDDKDTQPAEDDMDVDPPQSAAKPARGGKRKRTVSSSTRKNSSKSNGGKTPKQESSTPTTRPTKRLKSASNARGSGSSAGATRVFALWKQDGHYYSGTVHEQLGSKQYMIHFDDGDATSTELKHMRACRLRRGDNVLLSSKARAMVASTPPPGLAGHQATDEITIDLDEDGQETVQVQMLRLAPRTVSSEWADRMLTEATISPVVKPARTSPTPTPSEGSVRNPRKPLNKTAFVITYTPNHSGSGRDALVADIRQNGGIVLDDWSAIFAMEGVHAPKSQRWTLKAEDIKWKGRNDVDRAFLLSNDNHQKPKYLVALALGIPCLSVDWVGKVVDNRDEDWQPFLLPAGFSEHLNTRVSQLVDLDWGNCKEHLKEIAANTVPAKVFSGKSVLCVSPLFVPKQKGKKNADGGLAAAESVPQIILCMGAETVEAVTNVKHASCPMEEYDLVVVRDEDEDRNLKGAKCCVDVNWVKDCLISGRLLPTSGS